MTWSVRIVPLSAPALAALADGDLDGAQALCLIRLSPWLISPSEIGVWRRRASQVIAKPEDLPWVTGVLYDEAAGATVGRAGFHGAPDAGGMVELGYAIDPAHRRRGHARAALERSIDRARAHPDVLVLRLTISPHNAASHGLIAQYPFVPVGEQWDDEDGLELIHEIDVSS